MVRSVRYCPIYSEIRPMCFSERFSDVDTAKVEMAYGLCKYSATCEFQ